VPILLEEDRVCRRGLDKGAAVRVIKDRRHRQWIECPATPSATQSAARLEIDKASDRGTRRERLLRVQAV
jgi:hypothetical protein